MSSHREAPEISKDPVADNTDIYAFVSPDNPGTVTIIANYIPLELPSGGPNFFEFGDDVVYSIHIDNDADGQPEITYQFKFQTTVVNPEIFLYNVGPISYNPGPNPHPGQPYTPYKNWNRFQTYTVTRIDSAQSPAVTTVLGTNLITPPCNIGPRSTPGYAALAAPAIQSLGAGNGLVFAGQRAEGFYVDLGSVFDLADLRPFSSLHLIPMPGTAAGVNGTNGFNVHTIAIQVPIARLTSTGKLPTGATDPKAVIGVWAAASRFSVQIRGTQAPRGFPRGPVELGPQVQVSRLGNPLFNEVIVPMGKKDLWNALPPAEDSLFLEYVQFPALASLLPVLYPGKTFQNLKSYTKPRADLQAILLTGIPAGVVPGFPGNYTGPTPADQLRLNMAIPPAGAPNIYGLLGGDIAGFPNGRRVFDDVTTIELRAIAGATLPLVDKSFTPDGAAAVVSDFVLAGASPANVPVTAPYLSSFPYLGTPLDGYSVPPLPLTPNSLP